MSGTLEITLTTVRLINVIWERVGREILGTLEHVYPDAAFGIRERDQTWDIYLTFRGESEETIQKYMAFAKGCFYTLILQGDKLPVTTDLF